MVKMRNLVQRFAPELRGMAAGFAMVLMMGAAHAQADAAFQRLTTAMCSIYSALAGPFGVAVVILVFAVGAISLMVGGRKAVPIMIGAGIGGVVLAAAPSFARIFIDTQAC
jgi:type IV secretory pathway VirB2 component (pilin)